MKRLACILSIILVILPAVLACSCRSNPATTTTTEEDTTTEAITTLTALIGNCNQLTVSTCFQIPISACTSAISRHWATPAAIDMADITPRSQMVNCCYQTSHTL